MVEYLKFWLAQLVVGTGLTLLAVLILFVLALWSIRGQKSYKKPKEQHDG